MIFAELNQKTWIEMIVNSQYKVSDKQVLHSEKFSPFVPMRVN